MGKQNGHVTLLGMEDPIQFVPNPKVSKMDTFVIY